MKRIKYFLVRKKPTLFFLQQSGTMVAERGEGWWGGGGGAKSRGHSPGHFSPCTDKAKKSATEWATFATRSIRKLFHGGLLQHFLPEKFAKFST
jgi:hypothetical protein